MAAGVRDALTGSEPAGPATGGRDDGRLGGRGRGRDGRKAGADVEHRTVAHGAAPR